MPVNWEQLHRRLGDLSRDTERQSEALGIAQSAVRSCVEKYAADRGILDRIVSAVAAFDPNLRCALPGSERLDAAHDPPPRTPPATLLAGDGSQVTPDRHDQVLFGVVNVGIVTMRLGSGLAPSIATDTTLLFGENLYTAFGAPMSEGDIALLRDRQERLSLLRATQGLEGSVLALTDGPLELWGAKDVSDPSAFENALRDYLADLRALMRMGSTVAGYVDKPSADLVVRLFEVLEAPSESLKALRQFRPFRGVTDRWLFGQLLGPGQRSSIMGLQSTSKARYTDGISIHFFYLNVGSREHPAVARVEIPQWVAEKPDGVAALHSVLVEQCALLGAKPYPYILHRAHEAATITADEKAEIRQRLILDLYDAGIEPEDASGKSAAKAAADRKGRY